MKVKCRNCGAEFDSSLDKCPFCGAVYLPTAEKTYMKDLETERKNVEDLEKAPEENMIQETKESLSRVLKIIIPVLIVIIAIVIAAVVKQKKAPPESSLYEVKQELYPEWDSLYGKGDYGKLADAYYAACDQYGYKFYDYSHSSLADVILDRNYLVNSKEDATGGKNRKAYTGTLVAVLSYPYSSLCKSEDERTYLEGLYGPCWDFFCKHFNYSREEAEAYIKKNAGVKIKGPTPSIIDLIPDDEKMAELLDRWED